MSLLDYFRRRKRPVHDEPPVEPGPPKIRMPKESRATRASNSLSDLIGMSQAMWNIGLMYQRESFAWSDAARHLAAIVADVIMPDASQAERDEYAHDLAYEIMRAKAAHYDEILPTRAPAP